MPLLSRIRSVLDATIRRGAFERDMDDEFRLHLELRAEHLERAGLDPDEAARRARLEFGNVRALKDEARASRGLRLVDEIRSDVRVAVRGLASRPGLAATAVLTLTLGFGSAAAATGLAHAIFRPPLPFADPGTLVEVGGVDLRYPGSGIDYPKSAPDVGDLVGVRALPQVAAYARGGADLTGLGPPRRIRVAAVTADFFSLFRIPVEGRSFEAADEDPGAPPVVLLSAEIAALAPRSPPGSRGPGPVRINGRLHTVVGVAPAGFSFPENADAWVPLPAPLTPETMRYFGRHVPSRVVARLSPNATLASAQAELEPIFGRYRGATAESGDADHVRPLAVGLTEGRRAVALTLLGATALAVLVACANLATILLAQAGLRRHEMMVRLSVGASRARLIRFLSVESLLLALLGAAAGLGAAATGMPLLDRLLPPAAAGIVSVRMTVGVLAAVVLLTLATSCGFALVSATALRSPRLRAHGRAGRRTPTGDRGGAAGALRSLIVADVAMTVVLVIGAAGAMGSLGAARSAVSNLRPDGVRVFEVSLLSAGVAEPPARRDMLEGLLRQVEGAGRAALVDALPFVDPSGIRVRVRDADHPVLDGGLPHMGEDIRATPAYFEILGIGILRGRAPRASGTPDQPEEAAVNHLLAATLWPDREPLGRRIQLPGGRTLIVVGVVADAVGGAGDPVAVPQVYRALLDDPPDRATLLVAPGSDPPVAVSASSGVASEAPTDLSVFEVGSLDDLVGRALADRTLNAWLVTAFAAFALALCAIGIFGATRFGLRRRAPEWRVRVALGADLRSARRRARIEALLVIGAGAVGGLTVAWLLSRSLPAGVPGVEAATPTSLLASAGVVAAVSFLSALLPTLSGRALPREPERPGAHP